MGHGEGIDHQSARTMWTNGGSDCISRPVGPTDLTYSHLPSISVVVDAQYICWQTRARHA